MATPTTPAQIASLVEMFKRDQRSAIRELFMPGLFDRIGRLTIRQRPHTDDMFQMLADLGVEPADQISSDVFAFRIRYDETRDAPEFTTVNYTTMYEVSDWMGR